MVKLMMRTIYQPGSGRSVLHIDDIGSQFCCNTLDDFLLGSGTPTDIRDVPGVPVRQNAGLGFSGSTRASPGQDWESAGLIPDPDIRAVPAATSYSGVMTSEPPMTVLPVGIFPADVIDVVFEHPGVEVSTLTEMLLARSKASISSQHRGNAEAERCCSEFATRRRRDHSSTTMSP